MKTLYIACCIILGIALLPIAGGFYTLVRIAITIGAVIAAFQNSSNGINIWSIMFGIVALLFNPIIPVYLHDKGAWMMIDIIAMILKKFTSVDIGRALVCSDIAITVAGFFIFDVKTGLYSCFGLIIRSFLVDSFIESLNLSKYFNVVCSNPEPICDYIVHSLGRGATICEAHGAFTGEQKYIIFTALNRQQAIKLRNFIKENDPSSFILISNTSEIIGKGFHSI